MLLLPSRALRRRYGDAFTHPLHPSLHPAGGHTAHRPPPALLPPSLPSGAAGGRPFRAGGPGRSGSEGTGSRDVAAAAQPEDGGGAGLGPAGGVCGRADAQPQQRGAAALRSQAGAGRAGRGEEPGGSGARLRGGRRGGGGAEPGAALGLRAGGAVRAGAALLQGYGRAGGTAPAACWHGLAAQRVFVLRCGSAAANGSSLSSQAAVSFCLLG